MHNSDLYWTLTQLQKVIQTKAYERQFTRLIQSAMIVVFFLSRTWEKKIDSHIEFWMQFPVARKFNGRDRDFSAAFSQHSDLWHWWQDFGVIGIDVFPDRFLFLLGVFQTTEKKKKKKKKFNSRKIRKRNLEKTKKINSRKNK